MTICTSCRREFDENLGLCPYCGTPVEKVAERSPFLLPQMRLRDRYRIEQVKEYDSYTITYFAYDETLLQRVEIRELMPRELVTRSENGLGVVVIGPQEDRFFQDEKRKVLDEAKTLAKFQKEEGIVRILDSFEENGTIYIVMEYVEGELLSDLLMERGPMDAATASELITPISEALEEVHNMGIIHRSICPENIVVTPDGKGKLKNFGTARQQNVLNNETLTVSVRHGFTPEEQYYRSGVQGFSTDVYGLAATLYKMLTGLTPVDGMTRRADIESGKKDPLIMPRKLNKEISKGLEATILNGMAVKSEDRTGSIKGFLSELKSDKTISLNKSTIENKEDYKWPVWAKIGIPVGAVILALILFFIVKFGITKLGGGGNNLAGLIEVPGVEGMDKDPAIKDIEKSKLRGIAVGNIESDYVEAGKVVLQDPQKGAYLRENGAVLLTINGGKVKAPENGKATVPIVIWNTVEETEEKFQEAGLGRPIIVEEPSETVARGLVISTDTAYGTEVDEGSQVAITVSTGSAEPPSKELQKFGETLKEERIWVKENNEVLFEEPGEEGYTAISLDGVEFALFDGELDEGNADELSINIAPEDTKMKILNKDDDLEYIFGVDGETVFLIDILDNPTESETSGDNLPQDSQEESYYINDSRTRAAVLNTETIYDYGTAEEYNKPVIWVVKPTDEYSDIDEINIEFGIYAGDKNYDYFNQFGSCIPEKIGYPQQWYEGLIQDEVSQDVIGSFTYDAGVVSVKAGTGETARWGIIDYDGNLRHSVDVESPIVGGRLFTLQGVGYSATTNSAEIPETKFHILSGDYSEVKFAGYLPSGRGLPMTVYYFRDNKLYKMNQNTEGQLCDSIPDEFRKSLVKIANNEEGAFNAINGYNYISENKEIVHQKGFYHKNFVNGYYVGFEYEKDLNNSVWNEETRKSIYVSPKGIIKASTGDRITDFKYDDILYYVEGYCPVLRNGKWGFIDETGAEVSEMLFDKASSVYEGKIAVIYEGKFGIINLKEAISGGKLTKEILDAALIEVEEEPTDAAEEHEKTSGVSAKDDITYTIIDFEEDPPTPNYIEISYQSIEFTSKSGVFTHLDIINKGWKELVNSYTASRGYDTYTHRIEDVVVGDEYISITSGVNNIVMGTSSVVPIVIDAVYDVETGEMYSLMDFTSLSVAEINERVNNAIPDSAIDPYTQSKPVISYTEEDIQRLKCFVIDSAGDIWLRNVYMLGTMVTGDPVRIGNVSEFEHPVSQVAFDAKGIYSDMLDYFSDQYKNDWPDWDGRDSSTLKYPISYTFPQFKYTPSYCYIDLNDDGIEELIIGVDADYGLNIVNIYTIVDGEIKYIGESGERYGYRINKDKTVFYWGSAGFDNHSYKLLKLNDNGGFTTIKETTNGDDTEDWPEAMNLDFNPL